MSDWSVSAERKVSEQIRLKELGEKSEAASVNLEGAKSASQRTSATDAEKSGPDQSKV